MGVLNANPNGNFNSSIDSVHGKTRTWMEQAGVAGYLANVSAEAEAAVEGANAMIDALNALADYEATVEALGPTLEADAMVAAMASLDADLLAVLTETGLSPDEVQAAMVDDVSAAAAAERLAEEIGTLETAAAEAELAAIDAQAASEELFNNITKGKTLYDTPVENGAVVEEAIGDMVLGDVVYDYLVEKDEGWGDLYNEGMAAAEADALAEAEAAAAAEGGAVVEDDVVLLRTGDGETLALVVE